MGKKQDAVHVLKATARIQQVVIVSLAFLGPAAAYTSLFKERFVALCPPKARAKAYMKEGRSDWFVQFDTPFDESELDRLLIVIANELDLWIYIPPGINRAEYTVDLRSFTPGKADFDKPSNA